MFCCAAGADVIHRRGAQTPLEGELVRLDLGGAILRTQTGAEHVVPLDHVRSIECDGHRTDLDDMLQLADELWRARTRVERRDTVLAEPQLERLYAACRGESHETALVVAEGLLRCRLAHGRQVLAILPALDVMRLRRSGIETDAFVTLADVIDPAYELCQGLPPAWIDTRGLSRLANDLQNYEDGGDAVVAAIADLYRRLAMLQLGRVVERLDSASLPDHEGVELLADIVRTSDPDAGTRASARQRLQRRGSRGAAWVDAWCRFAIGRSYLRESGTGRRERGLIQLAHVPARHGAGQPFLSGLALEEMARGVESIGDSASALAIREELVRRYPAHPILAAPPPTQRTPASFNDRDAS
ncbi:MAG: hypothetical protein ACYTGR_12635 [Planctomycetota bacterium]|jgi:hypothetical protein